LICESYSTKVGYYEVFQLKAHSFQTNNLGNTFRYCFFSATEGSVGSPKNVELIKFRWVLLRYSKGSLKIILSFAVVKYFTKATLPIWEVFLHIVSFKLETPRNVKKFIFVGFHWGTPKGP